MLVYCSRCGTQNPDTNNNCTTCGAPLYTVGQRYPGSDRDHYRRMEKECFGLPNGNLIVGLFIGIIIILVGLNFLLQITYNISIPFWPLIVIIFGILIVAGAVYRNRRYSERINPA